VHALDTVDRPALEITPVVVDDIHLASSRYDNNFEFSVSVEIGESGGCETIAVVKISRRDVHRPAVDRRAVVVPGEDEAGIFGGAVNDLVISVTVQVPDRRCGITVNGMIESDRPPLQWFSIVMEGVKISTVRDENFEIAIVIDIDQGRGRFKPSTFHTDGPSFDNGAGVVVSEESTAPCTEAYLEVAVPVDIPHVHTGGGKHVFFEGDGKTVQLGETGEPGCLPLRMKIR